MPQPRPNGRATPPKNGALWGAARIGASAARGGQSASGHRMLRDRARSTQQSRLCPRKTHSLTHFYQDIGMTLSAWRWDTM